MKAVKYLFALWAAAAVYVVTSLLWGSMGLSAQDQLREEGKKQQANMAELRRINQELENTRNALLYDRDTLVLHARELGYASPEERFVRIVGLQGIRQVRTGAGQVVYAAEPEHIPDIILRIISVSLGIGIFMAIGLWDFLRFCRRRAQRPLL